MENYGKVVVLAGGPSSEREISLKSGRAVFNALRKRRCDVDFLDVGADFAKNLENKRANIAFLALHGRFGEDGTVQKMLEGLSISYTGSGVESSRLALDKIASKEIFVKNGVRVPGYAVISKGGKTAEEILCEFKLPCVVKPRNEGSSIGLTIVRDKSRLGAALDEAFRYDRKILVEEYIHGRELTVGILEEEALPVIEIVAKNMVYDYNAKYEDTQTRYIVPANLKKEEYENAQDLGLKAHRLLNCRDFSRVDMRMDDEGNIFVLEVNTIPGMTERSLLPKAASAVGIDFDELCSKLVGLAHKRKGERR